MLETRGWAAFDGKTPLKAFSFQRREPGPKDILIDIVFCGVCHSDLHQVRGEWGNSTYPMVPGHEIVGRVSRVGALVSKFTVGELAGVGCFVDSCRTCDPCKRGIEQYCEAGNALTYNGTEMDRKTPTYGGYSQRIVVDEAYAVKVTKGQPLEQIAPLLCAGVTTWSPLRHWEIGKGHRIAVMGLGGLGHMAVKLGAALGAEVTVLGHSPKKKDDAKRLGAQEYVVTSDRRQLKARRRSFDFILNTVSADHEIAPFIDLLKLDGTMVLVGAPEHPLQVPPFSLIGQRRSVAGSVIGGIKETQDVLDFCAAKNLGADVEIIRAQDVDGAYERMLKGDVKYRFVIDTSSL